MFKIPLHQDIEINRHKIVEKELILQDIATNLYNLLPIRQLEAIIPTETMLQDNNLVNLHP